MSKKVSSYRRRIVGGMILYGILTLCVIPILTISAGTQNNILEVSMSAMGNSSAASRALFLTWTIVFVVTFASLTGYLLMLTKNTRSKIRWLVTFATVVLVIGNIVPFIPDVFPKMAGMHNLFAQISSISLAIVLMLFTLTLRKTYSIIFKRSLIFVLIIWAVMIGLTTIFGAASITTMSGTMVAGIFMFVVLVWLYMDDKFDPVQSLKEKDASEATEEADKLWKRAEQARNEYLKLEAAARKARIEAEEASRIARYKPN